MVLWMKIPVFLRNLGHFAIQLCPLRDTIRAPNCSEEMRREFLARVALQFQPYLMVTLILAVLEYAAPS